MFDIFEECHLLCLIELVFLKAANYAILLISKYPPAWLLGTWFKLVSAHIFNGFLRYDEDRRAEDRERRTLLRY